MSRPGRGHQVSTLAPARRDRGLARWTRPALGILTALGGLVDVGNLVANPQAGATYGMSLTLVVVVSAIGVMVFTEMSGRVTAVTGKAGFEIVAGHLPRWALAVAVLATGSLTLMTAAAEVGGAALVLGQASGINGRLWLPAVAAGLAVTLWRMPLSWMQAAFSLAGLAMLVMVAVVVAGPVHWNSLAAQVARPWPVKGPLATYLYSVVAQVGSIMVPYQLIFFSSGASEERWTREDLGANRLNVLIGYPLGMLIVLALMAAGTAAYHARGVNVTSLAQVVALPGLLGAGGLAGAVLLFGMLATTSGAALETTLTLGYLVCQSRSRPWGKVQRPKRAPWFYGLSIGAVVVGAVVVAAGVDVVRLTDWSLVLSTVALPVTYIPVLLAGRDRRSMGACVNSRLLDLVGVAFVAVVVLVALAAVPLIALVGSP